MREIRMGHYSLANYAEEVNEDFAKGARIRNHLVETEAFFEKEGLLDIDPNKAVVDFRKNESLRQVELQSNHYSAVAEEILRVDNGQFVHDSARSVVRALRGHIDNKTDLRVKNVAYDTIEGQIRRGSAGLAFDSAFSESILGRKNDQTISDIVKADIFDEHVKSEGWRQTLRYASEVLPRDTNTRDIYFLLISFPRVRQYKDIDSRLSSVRKFYTPRESTPLQT